MSDLFDWAAARAGRDEGMERTLAVEEPDWQAEAVRLAANVPKGWVGLFEDVRRYLTARGLPPPHTYHCWGALSRSLITLGMFERVDDWGQPQGVKSHGSIYRKIRRL